MQTIEEVRSYLYGLRHHGAKYGIDRMRLLAARLGDPQKSFPVIHVAGTNGKGSVCAMLENIYRLAGYRTGLYTSPHLVRQGERIRVNGQPLADEDIVKLTAELHPLAGELAAHDADDHPSFFEFMTAMAFLVFAREQVDVAILETGLGGRLDATNVVDPILSVITTIGMDHMELLGNTLAAIAGEKAGIIKPGRPVAMGLLADEAAVVVDKKAAACGAPLHKLAERFHPGQYPACGLAGNYQRENAALAWLCSELVAGRFPVTDAHRRNGLLQVRWPGRWQVGRFRGGTLILDTTHNAGGICALEENLQSWKAGCGREKLRVIFGSVGEGRAEPLLRALVPFAASFILVEPKQPRAVPTAKLRCILERLAFAGEVQEGSVEKIFSEEQSTLFAGGKDCLAVGSIYLVGEICEYLEAGKSLGGHLLQDVTLPKCGV